MGFTATYKYVTFHAPQEACLVAGQENGVTLGEAEFKSGLSNS